MNQTVFTGSACAIITPFDSDGKVDYRKLKKQVEFQIENGTDAIVVCGTTGESSVLNTREHRQVIKSVVKYVEKRVPVIAGTGSNSTESAVRRSCSAESVGADALLIVTPYYNKCSQAGLIEHYDYISERTSLPVIVYNVPARTGVDIKPETYKELSKIRNVVATKEANGNISALMKTISLCKDELDIYCGNDDQTAAFMAMGAKGVISVLANIIPNRMHGLASLALGGKTAESVAKQTELLDLANVLFCDVNPIPVKYAMKVMELDSGVYRLPLNDTSEINKRHIRDALRKQKLIN
ncbi:MAG: 4-hydroxy-tetrahydrodipicolinate synthase [Clostridia bacterium]|nr:4-hydroxy-tetrahydrodipicolinate synthase [Clostridia bacterium]